MKEGESYQEFSQRVLDFFYSEIIPSLEKEQKVIIISHKYVIELFCNLILEKPLNKKFDLRLPNAEVLNADNISQYTRHENEKLNIFKDWLVIQHHWVFTISLFIGLLLNYLGFFYEAHPLVLLFLLVFATAITMARINIESSLKYIFNKNTILLITLRYLLIPCLFIFSLLFSKYYDNEILATLIIFISTPTAIIAITISRSIGGFIIPTLSYTILASILSIIPFTLAISIFFEYSIYYVFYICVFVIGFSLLIPFLFILQSRKIKPIKTAKFGERNAYLAIIFISAFIILSSIKLVEIPLTEILVATTIAIVLRVIAGMFSLNSHINSLDTYISMSYPNIFLIIVIASMMNNSFIEEIAILFLLPMFLFSNFDNWYSRFFHINTNDSRLHSILDIPK